MGAVDQVLIFIINRIKYQKQCYVSPNCGSSGYFRFINHRSFQEPKPDFGIEQTNLSWIVQSRVQVLDLCSSPCASQILPLKEYKCYTV